MGQPIQLEAERPGKPMNREIAVLRFATARLGRPFAWGVTDCALLALEAVDAQAGTELAARYRGQWTSEAEALAWYQQELPSEVLAAAGLAEVPPRTAVIGDVILNAGDRFPQCMAVCLGKRALTAEPERGVGQVPTRLLVHELRAPSVWRLR